MTIITMGIDLAKNIFAVHRVNESDHAELVKPRVSRDQLLPLIANLPARRQESQSAANNLMCLLGIILWRKGGVMV